MQSHLHTHSGGGKSCAQCGTFCTNENAYRDHMKSHDPAKLKHHCTLCPKKFVKLSRFQDHLATHSDLAFWKCQLEGCKDPRVTHKSGWKAHLIKWHKDLPTNTRLNVEIWDRTGEAAAQDAEPTAQEPQGEGDPENDPTVPQQGTD